MDEILCFPLLSSEDPSAFPVLVIEALMLCLKASTRHQYLVSLLQFVFDVLTFTVHSCQQAVMKALISSAQVHMG